MYEGVCVKEIRVTGNLNSVITRMHCVKSVRRSFPGPYFPTLGLNTQRYGVSLRIQSECRKIMMITANLKPHTELRAISSFKSGESVDYSNILTSSPAEVWSKTYLVASRTTETQGNYQDKEIFKHVQIIRKKMFACPFSVHNTISLRHEQVCLMRLRFERYFSHHRAT